MFVLTFRDQRLFYKRYGVHYEIVSHLVDCCIIILRRLSQLLKSQLGFRDRCQLCLAVGLLRERLTSSQQFAVAAVCWCSTLIWRDSAAIVWIKRARNECRFVLANVNHCPFVSGCYPTELSPTEPGLCVLTGPGAAGACWWRRCCARHLRHLPSPHFCTITALISLVYLK